MVEQFDVGIIGTDEAYNLNGAEDHRNISISDTISLMNRCEMVVGQSSGPMHLASLCGTPHFVWSDPINKIRYEKYWNPHKTEINFYDKSGWNPTPKEVFDELLKIY